MEHFTWIMPMALAAGLAACGRSNDAPALPIAVKHVDDAFWSKLDCRSLDKLAFEVEFFLGDSAKGADRIWFQNDTLHCETCLAQGLATDVTVCYQREPGKVSVKAILARNTEQQRRYVATLHNGTVEGTLDVGTKQLGVKTFTFKGTAIR